MTIDQRSVVINTSDTNKLANPTFIHSIILTQRPERQAKWHNLHGFPNKIMSSKYKYENDENGWKGKKPNFSR